MQNIGMLASIWTTIGNLLTGFFAIIPQTIYFLFTAAASLMDLLQFVVRKLAGLDVYYVNGTAQEGDIVTNIVEGILGINAGYSVLSTVFWAMIIFSVVLLVLATIIQMIRAHYDYDKERSTPFNIIKKALMGLFTLAIIPITTIFGMYISEGLLMGLDAITSGASQDNMMSVFEKEAVGNFASSTSGSNKVYSSLDFYHQHRWSKSPSFAGVIFNVATHNSNRVRRGEYTVVVGEANTNWTTMDVFWTTNEVNTKEVIATQIDTAFEYCLRLNEAQNVRLKGDSASLALSYSNLSLIYAKDLILVDAFSKYDVGLVWYYYNLFLFDFFLGYAGIMTGVVLLFNLILGLATRLFYLVIMFIIYPPITALYPFDEGKGVKSWRIEFMKSYVATYSAVVGLNIVLLILPVLRTFKLFNNGFLDALITALFTLSGLVVVKKILSMFSKLIGAEDLQEVGGKMAKEFASTTAKAIKGVMKLANVGIAGLGALKASKLNAVNGMKNAGKGIYKKRINDKMKAAGLKGEGEKGKFTDKQREDFLKNEKINKLIDKDNLKYTHLAGNAMKAELGEEGVHDLLKNKGDEYSRRYHEYMQKFAEADLGKGPSKSKKVDEKLHSKKGVYYGNQALQNLNKRFGNDKIDAMRKNDNATYRELLEEEKRRIASNELRTERKAKLKETGGKVATGFADITGETLKLFGDMTQIKGMFDTFKKEGVVDAFATSAKNFTKTVGMEFPNLKTESDKKEEENKAQEQYRKNLEKLAESYEVQSTTGQIEALTTEFKRYYTRRLGDEAVEKYFKKKSGKYKAEFNKFSNSEKDIFTKYVQEDEKKADKFIEDRMKKDKPKDKKDDEGPLPT